MLAKAAALAEGAPKPAPAAVAKQSEPEQKPKKSALAKDSKPKKHKVDTAAEQLGALETELRALKPSALGRRARDTEGIAEGAIDAALDDDNDSKAALIRVMLAHAAKEPAADEAKRKDAPAKGGKPAKKKQKKKQKETESAPEGEANNRRRYDAEVLGERARAAATAAKTEEFTGRASMIDMVALVYAENPTMGSKPLYRKICERAGGQRNAPSGREVRKMLAAIKEGKDLQNAIDEAQPFSRESKLASAAARRQEEGPKSADGDCKVFVANMAFTTTEEELKAFFAPGEVEDICWLQKPKEEGGNDDKLFTGTAFLRFSTAESAREAVGKHGQVLLERELNINFAKPRKPGQVGGPERAPRESKWGKEALGEKPEGCTTIFVGNLPYEIDDGEIHEFAKDCGVITGIRWLNDRESGKFKGCGFIDFADTESVDEFALKNGQALKGRAIRIDYASPKQQGDADARLDDDDDGDDGQGDK